MIRAFCKAIKAEIHVFGSVVRTREFWLYMALIVVLVGIAWACIRLSTAFDPLTRGQLGLSFNCRTGEGQLATIIVGGFVFGLACLFTIGEVVHWIELNRALKAPGRRGREPSVWRPVAHVLGTLVLGGTGYALMLSWCR